LSSYIVGNQKLSSESLFNPLSRATDAESKLSDLERVLRDNERLRSDLERRLSEEQRRQVIFPYMDEKTADMSNSPLPYRIPIRAADAEARINVVMAELAASRAELAAAKAELTATRAELQVAQRAAKEAMEDVRSHDTAP